jgi:hypothetical protein
VPQVPLRQMVTTIIDMAVLRKRTTMVIDQLSFHTMVMATTVEDTRAITAVTQATMVATTTSAVGTEWADFRDKDPTAEGHGQLVVRTVVEPIHEADRTAVVAFRCTSDANRSPSLTWKGTLS